MEAGQGEARIRSWVRGWEPVTGMCCGYQVVASVSFLQLL